MSNSGEIDFSTRPYEEWVKTIFEHDEEDLGSGLASFPENPVALVRHLTRLCQDLPDLIKQYDWLHISQGLWAALSFHFSVPSNYFARDQVPVEEQIHCIRSMQTVFSDVVAKIPAETEMENIFFMWWDLVCASLPEPGEVTPEDKSLRQHYYALLLPVLFSEDSLTDRECSLRISALKVASDPGIKYFFGQWSESAVSHFRLRQLPIYNALFEALKELLTIADQRCQSCILHGLGHLIHPGRYGLVQRFIDQHQDQIRDTLQWMEQCRDGTVM